MNFQICDLAVRSIPIQKSLIIRFATVGVLVAGVYLVLFSVLVDWLKLSPANGNFIAFTVAVLFQYVSQSMFTFGKKANDVCQFVRFVVSVILGLLISHIITVVLSPMIGMSNMSSALMVVVVLPLFNFLIFRTYVFTSKKQT